MTSVSGTMFGARSMVYNDDNRMTSIAYGGTTDYYYYTYTGLRYRATLAGTTYRYLYNGERVLEELNDSGTMQARYTTESGSYYGALLHLYRPTGTLSRFPMYDNIGSVRGLVDASGAVTDTYELDTFGRSVSSTGATPNPYRYGGAWGYITDPSGMLQLGERYYWPELGRFVSQDPIRDGGNWYAYADNRPTTGSDPTGKTPPFQTCLQDYKWQIKNVCGKAIYRGMIGVMIGACVGGALAGMVGGGKAGFVIGEVIEPLGGGFGGAIVGGAIGAITGCLGGAIGGVIPGVAKGVYDKKTCKEDAEKTLDYCLDKAWKDLGKPRPR